MAAWIALALLMTGDSTCRRTTAFADVRSSEARIREAIVDGYVRSATFRKLVDAAEGLPCVVYVATAVKLPHDMQGALLHWSAGSPETPVLRVLVKNNLTPEEADRHRRARAAARRRSGHRCALDRRMEHGRRVRQARPDDFAGHRRAQVRDRRRGGGNESGPQRVARDARETGAAPGRRPGHTPVSDASGLDVRG